MDPNEPLANGERPDSMRAYDKADSTRIGMILGICVSILVAIGALIVTITSFTSSYLAFEANPIVAQIIPLAFNAVVSVCTDVLSYAHSVSLRWALYREGRLDYNSNLRLFTSAKKCKLNKWPTNILSAVMLIISYTAANQTVLIYKDKEYNFHFINFNPVALLMLTVSFLGQILIAFFCMRQAKRQVWTWSSNAPNAALAQLSKGRLTPATRLGSTSSGHGNDDDTVSNRPQKQEPMAGSSTSTKRIAWFLAVMLGVCIAFAGLIAGLTAANHQADEMSFFVNPTTNRTSNEIQFHGVVEIDVLPKSPNVSFILLGFIMFIWGTAFQTIVTLTLHCIELIVNTSRDEAQWRAASGSKGARLSVNPIISAISSWQWWVLFTLKPLVQWLFGTASMSLGQQGVGDPIVWFNCVPLFVLSVVVAVLLGFVLLLVYSKPKGRQPAVYGHLQTMVDLVDDWGTEKNEKLFWNTKKGKVGVKTENSLG